MLTGNIVALGTSGIITVTWSFIRPDNYGRSAHPHSKRLAGHTSWFSMYLADIEHVQLC